MLCYEAPTIYGTRLILGFGLEGKQTCSWLYYNIGLNMSLINLQDCIEDVNYNHHSFPNAGTAVSSRIII